jgi:hypothetical protein
MAVAGRRSPRSSRGFSVPLLLTPQVTVSMSFSFAKVLAAYLTSAVSAVEQELGPVKIPAGEVMNQKATMEALVSRLKQARIG